MPFNGFILLNFGRRDFILKSPLVCATVASIAAPIAIISKGPQQIIIHMQEDMKTSLEK